MGAFDLVVPDDAYKVITPLGVLAAFFPDDGPVQWTGAKEAKECFQYVLLGYMLPGGYSMRMESMDEQTLYDLIDLIRRDQYYILISEPANVFKEAIEQIMRCTKQEQENIIEVPVLSQPKWVSLDVKTFDDFVFCVLSAKKPVNLAFLRVSSHE